MKRGFTILELLVASLLLGMLMTILTMIFNQSSIAWRAGEAGVADLDEARANIAKNRFLADNVYVWKNDVGLIMGIYDRNGNLRTRSFSKAPGGSDDGEDVGNISGYLRTSSGSGKGSAVERTGDRLNVSGCWGIGVNGGNNGKAQNTYTVNVRSAGPNRRHMDRDDIWSFPNEIQMD